MNRADIQELAASMVRMYGPRMAFDIADRYAHDATALEDKVMHARWAEVAAILAKAIEADGRV